MAEALQALSPALRLLVVEGINGSRVVDDSYNASPESVLAALNLLLEPGSVAELRVLKTPKGTVSGYFTDFAKPRWGEQLT